MKETTRVFAIYKVIALAISLVFMQQYSKEVVFITGSALAFLCIFIIMYALDLKCNGWKRESLKGKWLGKVNLFLILLLEGVLLGLGIEEWQPIFIVLGIELISYLTEEHYFYGLSVAGFIVMLGIYPGSINLVLINILVLITLLMTINDSKKLSFYKILNSDQREQLIHLEEQIKDNERLIKTIKYSAVLEERNRLSARLHDKIGHSISSSIIMLEAAMLQMKKDQEKALISMQKATAHLREGVDDIRKALREERPIRSDLGSNDIQLLLDEANAKHELHTIYRTKGNLEQVNLELWQCIKENVGELLTNVLKHSKASAFTVEIKVMTAMVKVSYYDNGVCKGKLIKGLGLEAVEERTIKCNGKCFFEMNEIGFKVINIFLIS